MAAIPRLAALLPFGLALAAAQAAAQGPPPMLDSLALGAGVARMESFARALPAEERAAWNALLRRAARGPRVGREVRVVPVLGIGPGGGCRPMPGQGGAVGGRVDFPDFVADLIAGVFDAIVTASITQMESYAALVDSAAASVQRLAADAERPAAGIIVQGGRETRPAEGIIVQGGREGIIVQGGRQTRPAEGIIVQGGREGIIVQGGREHPLARSLLRLAAASTPSERLVLEWLLTRAASAPPVRGARMAPVPTLRDALGVTGGGPWTVRC